MKRPDDGAESASDERMLAIFIAGDEAGFTALVERYSQELYQFVARFVRNVAVAEDVVQETFVQVYQSATRFDPSRRFRPWVFTIAANKARDHLRSRTRKREVSLSGGGSPEPADAASYLDFLADDSPQPGDALEAEEQQEIVRSVVSQMPDNLREVLVLGYFHRFPYKEIAAVLSIPLGTVKSRLHAAVSHFGAAYKKRMESGRGESG